MLLPKVESLLFQYENLLQEIESMKCLEKGRLSIGSYTSMARTFLPSVIKEFHKLYPLIEISIQEDAYKELYEAVQNQTVDLAFMSHIDSPPSGNLSSLSSFQFIPIKKDPLYLFSSIDFFVRRRFRIIRQIFLFPCLL